MAQWFGLRTCNVRVVSSNIAVSQLEHCRGRKSSGNYLVKSTSLEKLRALSLVCANFGIVCTVLFMLGRGPGGLAKPKRKK